MGMAQKHPLIEYAERHSKSMAEIAKDAGCSRMTLYRLVAKKQNATIDLLERVSKATNGEVSPSDFLVAA